MKTILGKIKTEIGRLDSLAAICCLVLSLTIFFIMKVLDNDLGF